ncbi:hypothetical protein SUGI_0261170 [Cryptomeria japonica]|uniref:uncharacterized protein At4g14100 n=1 Tax=Cryptomeria japonica TaxID=3369 RepID=UPI002408B0D5|nr:uncharacterized protein At4g14100 [Cryptomeria japonica]GLJ15835.1 hypothetical protein SUGI_0261170 [Cryptomeria japonica]
MTTMKAFLTWLILMHILYAGKSSEADPVPAAWPEQFHSILYINNSGSLQVTDLWYDWPNGRNFNIIQKQLGRKLYDLEWNNGTSFYYYLDKNECKMMHFEVGILRPNWLEGAHYVGVRSVDGFLCNVWEKVDFIHYYEDIVTKRPVHWLFYTGMSVHVMTFEVGSNLEDVYWQAPAYCFEEEDGKGKRNHIKKESHLGRILAGLKHIALFQ